MEIKTVQEIPSEKSLNELIENPLKLKNMTLHDLYIIYAKRRAVDRAYEAKYWLCDAVCSTLYYWMSIEGAFSPIYPVKPVRQPVYGYQDDLTPDYVVKS